MYAMSTVLLSIKTDNKTKQDLRDFATELGISSTAFVNLVVRQALRDRRFTLDAGLQPTPYLEEAIHKAEFDLESGLASTALDKSATRKHLQKLMKKT
jgi:antitoxin component of RelBE/YafQ-DinJ toxin-antitoxin module